ncbi:MAB_1171c family putative transporter [Streptomyces sp. AM6-12]|uniref:MAB_1171c family putative transporter n=1 Tax=Streptomyces sp. AM6-12 TaxID=3345149 RepID=UPI0037B789A1
MTHGVAALGARLELPSVLLVWIAVLLRGPAGLRSAPQRAVWLAVATAAAAMTLNLPSLIGAATRHSEANVVAVIRNVLGVLSAGAVLYFVAQATADIGRLRTALALAVGSVLTVLLSLDLAAWPHLRIGVSATGSPAPSRFYWLLLISTHLVANSLCVLLCLRYGTPSGNLSLATSLRLFGLGTGLVSVYWLGYLVRVTTGGRWPLPWLALLMDLHGVLRALAIMVPTFAVLRRVLSSIAVAWRLWPMWNDLVTAVPHVALAKPRPRIWDVLWPQVPYSVLSYRRVIETRDAILALTDYISAAPSSPGPSPRRGSSADLSADELAHLVQGALNAKLQGSIPTRQRVNLGSSGSRDLAGETAFLLRMARAYRSASPHGGARRQ